MVILVVMKSAPLWIVATLSALAVTGCEAELEDDDAPLGGGSLDSSVAEAEVEAPDPRGQQLTHEEMAQALESTVDSAAITDTDDWWPNLRDLNRELQRLAVDPTDCKPYVTASALPAPLGALGALAESDDSQTLIYTFEDADAAQDYVDSERMGLERCQEHTVTRDLGDEEVEAATSLTELSVLTGAEDGFAVGREMEASDTTQRDLTVLLRHGPHTVLTAEPEDPDADQDEAVAELEARAAEVLSEVVGEEILAPEPEPEDDQESESDESSDDEVESDEDDSPQDSDEDDDADESNSD